MPVTFKKKQPRLVKRATIAVTRGSRTSIFYTEVRAPGSAGAATIAEAVVGMREAKQESVSCRANRVLSYRMALLAHYHITASGAALA